MLKKIFSPFKFIRKIPKKFLFLGLILIIAGSGWYFYANSKGTEPIKTVVVKKTNIKSTISTSGVLTGKKTANLRFKTSGKLAYLTIEQNSLVKNGQVIAGLDTQQLNITLQQAQNTLRSAQAAAEKAEDDVKDHSKDETFTQKQTRTASQVTRDNAFDSVKEAQRAFQDAVLVSPISGRVTNISVVEGQNITVSDQIAQIVDDSEIYFDAEVDESDLGKVSLNMPAEVSLNAYEDRTFKGFVTGITPITKTTSTGATIVIARIKIDFDSSRFIAGLNGQAEIINEQLIDVITIPSEALKDETTVYVKKNSKFEERKVETGISSDTETEIKSGLSLGEEVVINPEEIKK